MTAVAPGTTETQIHAAGGAPVRVAHVARTVAMGRAAQPQEIARAESWLLSEDASYVSGAVLRVAGGA